MQVAEVKIWPKLAGAVAWDAETGVAPFENDPKFKPRWGKSQLPFCKQ
jgi:serine/threonine-protein kinase HipA